jgi:hypothetical protein
MNHPQYFALSLVATVAACSSGGTDSAPGATSSAALDIANGPGAGEDSGHPKDESCGLPPGLAALPGYSISIWAQGTKDYSNPDSIEVDGNDIWVGYQNVTAKDGTDGKTSTVVEYTLRGRVERTFSVPGHCDGLRIDPATHVVYATSNEDGNPALTTIDPTGVLTHYTFDPTVHGGGYDDLGFVGGKIFIAASNPTLDASGVNVFPALDELALAGTKANVSPVLLGNASATDVASGATVTLNEIDPDSITIDPSGDLVLDNQAGSELVFIKNPGTASQSVSRLSLPTQVDDTVWATAAEGRLFVVDATANTIYAVRSHFVPGTVFTETPDDSTVASLVGTIDLTTGKLSPQILGFQKATGLLFLADR